MHTESFNLWQKVWTR